MQPSKKQEVSGRPYTSSPTKASPSPTQQPATPPVTPPVQPITPPMQPITPTPPPTPEPPLQTTSESPEALSEVDGTPVTAEPAEDEDPQKEEADTAHEDHVQDQPDLGVFFA